MKIQNAAMRKTLLASIAILLMATTVTTQEVIDISQKHGTP